MNNEKYDLGILFVDDEQQTLKYFRRAFEREFPIFAATSAKEGLAILDEHSDRIAILVTDQRMPEQRGVELLKYARREYPNIVRILTTGFTDLDDAIEAVNSGEIHRYITKPWDLSALHLELKQSMQFFLIRRERDELLREKLSAWQRLEGVNRLREIVAMASGFTLTRNPLRAVESFIEQIPVSHPSNATSNFGSWGQLPDELRKIVDTCAQIVGELSEKAKAPFSSGTIDTLFKSALSSMKGERIVLDAELERLSVEANAPLMNWALASLIAWSAESPGSGLISVDAIDRDDRFEISISIEEGSWNKTSLLEFPSELLGAYFVCHHHFGELNIGPLEDGVFSIGVELPKRQADQTETPPDLSWIEHALPRFENW